MTVEIDVNMLCIECHYMLHYWHAILIGHLQFPHAKHALHYFLLQGSLLGRIALASHLDAIAQVGAFGVNVQSCLVENSKHEVLSALLALIDGLVA